MSEPPITVLIADDHAMVRRGIRGFLEASPGFVIVAEASSGADACRLAADHTPDVALIDLVMPGTDGIEAIHRITASSSRTRIIALTSFDDDEHILPAIRAGATSYLLKDIGPAELAEAIRRTAAGESVLNPRVAARVVSELHGIRHGLPNPFRELSDRELEVMRLIAEGRTNAEISGTLQITEKTVKSHVGSILSKLQLTDRTQAAVLAWRQGVIRRD
jgi:NarL family two-component system response regulator LiaR